VPLVRVESGIVDALVGQDPRDVRLREPDAVWPVVA
jgi:hypothetical protein